MPSAPDSLSGLTPAYLADDINLVDEPNRTAYFSNQQPTGLCRSTCSHSQNLWWQEFRCCRSASVEQSQLRQDTSYGHSNGNWTHFCSGLDWPRLSVTALFAP